MAARAVATPVRPSVRLFPYGWYLGLVFAVFPLWWALGVQGFVWPLLAVPLLISLLARGRVAVPRRFGAWLLFLGWMTVSGVQLTEAERGIAFLYRGSLYVVATILFLYVFNASREALPSRRVLGALTVFWLSVVAGGYLGILLPDGGFVTLAERAVPESLQSVRFVRALVHADFAENVLATPRPHAPFAFANEWGANFALLLPLVLGYMALTRSRLVRAGLVLALAAAIVPVVVSGNRGMWIALGVAFAYVAVRLALRAELRVLGGLAALALLAAVLVLATPLGGTVSQRLQFAPGSDELRLTLYREAIQRAEESPLVGFGAPQPSAEDPEGPSVGTHGHVFLVLVSNGIPALALFLGWLLYTLVRSGRPVAGACFWARVTVLVALVEAPYYELFPVGLLIVMLAAGLAWREIEAPRRGAEAA